ncbi:MAG: TrkH family potassium uptake protein [Candidatus Hadarchaeota archaeon]
MIPLLKREDLKIIGYNLSKICYIVGAILFLPIIVAVAYSEFNTIPSFLIGSAVSFILGALMSHFLYTKKEMEVKHAVVMAALAWLLAPILASIPISLAGATGSYLDASFESISGFTGTGLTLVPDIDHLARSVNFFRHFLQFLGDGIGIIVISLSILGRTEMSSVLAFKGEAKDLGIKPSIVRTSRTIIGIAVTFLIIGTIMFTVAGAWEGLDPGTAFFDGLNHSMTGYATGGFSVRSQNLLYYHSIWVEVAAIIIMVIGAFNFNFHYAVLGGRRREILKNMEVKILLFAMLAFGLLVAANLLFMNLYPSGEALFRKGIFHVISAQTTTGFQTVPSSHFMFVWPVFSMLLLSIAMVIGGCANSTSGGIKMLRIGVLFKSLFRDVKQALLPRTAVVRSSFHHIDDNPLTDTVVKGAAVIALSYLVLFLMGAMITAAHGYSLEDSMFETASALGNVGLSSGITTPSMAPTLKITYMFLMWAGKLEIMAVFVLFGFVILGLRRGIEK